MTDETSRESVGWVVARFLKVYRFFRLSLVSSSTSVSLSNFFSSDARNSSSISCRQNVQFYLVVVLFLPNRSLHEIPQYFSFIPSLRVSLCASCLAVTCFLSSSLWRGGSISSVYGEVLRSKQWTRLLEEVRTDLKRTRLNGLELNVQRKELDWTLLRIGDRVLRVALEERESFQQSFFCLADRLKWSSTFDVWRLSPSLRLAERRKVR